MMKTFVPFSFSFFVKSFIALLLVLFAFIALNAQGGPELVFTNPVLVSGIANKQGAVYRFSNVTTGVDAEIKLKKFSRPDIVMQDVDLSSLGWDKAFQPQFGLAGNVPANQNWYIDFELNFFKAGTSKLRVMDTVNLTALDVDGDGGSLSEYVTYNKPSSIAYSTASYLTNSTVGNLGQLFICDSCGLPSILVACHDCNGTGITNSGSGNNNPCPTCDGSGLVYLLCGHPYEGQTGNTVWGPTTNFTNIDTGAVQVMATYQFLKASQIKFTYGAKTGAGGANGSAIRLNSTWFRNFSLTPLTTLPVKLINFSARYMKPNVALAWTTAQEHNFSHFIIEHSTDGSNFTQTAIVFGSGESDIKKDYTYTDKDMKGKGGIIYYRLKQVDIDGSFTYSSVRVVSLNEVKASVSLTTFPNPVTNNLRLTLPPLWQNKHVTIELYYANGQHVNSFNIANSGPVESISLASLQKGVYFIQAACGNELASQQIIKN